MHGKCAHVSDDVTTALVDAQVLGGLTALSSNASTTNSAIFTTSIKQAATHMAAGGGDGANVHWEKVSTQPTSMDEDSMPKDRMALLADPHLSDIFYVAGNAGALVRHLFLNASVWGGVLMCVVPSLSLIFKLTCWR
jgi:hypothetical protein